MKTLITLLLICFSLVGFSQRSAKSGHVRFRLSEIVIDHDTLCFATTLSNNSLLGYTPMYVQFIIRDRHKATRTAVQEKELYPLMPFQTMTIFAKSSLGFIFLFKQFTLPETKELVILIKERNGSRDMRLHIPGAKLMRMIKSKKEQTD
jgi:hypothetical protein